MENVLCERVLGSVDMRGSVGSVLCERVCGECVV